MNVPRRRADVNLHRALHLHPLLAHNIPHANVLLPQRKRHSLALPGAEKRAREATQDLGRLAVTVGEAEVQLRDFVAREFARVLHAEGDGGGCLVECGRAADVADGGGAGGRGAGGARCVP